MENNKKQEILELIEQQKFETRQLSIKLKEIYSSDNYDAVAHQESFDIYLKYSIALSNVEMLERVLDILNKK